MASGLTDTHEMIEYNKNMPIKLFCQRIGVVTKHWHRSIEILLVLSGTLQVRVENQQYELQENDILLINSDQVHDTSSDDCVLVLLQMRLSSFHLDWLNPETIHFECNSSMQENSPAFDQIRELIARLIKLNATSSSHQVLSLSYAYQIIYVLLQNFISSNPGKLRPPKQMERLKHIIRYVEENYQRDLTLTEIAQEECLTPPYLSSFFEKNMNMTLTSYISKIRLEHSLHFLMNTDKSIEEISEACGFANQRSYATLFKKQYGALPSIYRKNSLTFDNKANSLPMNATAQYLNLEKYDFYDKLSTYLHRSEETPFTNADQKVHYSIRSIHTGTAGKRLEKNYSQFCSVGRAKEILMGNIQKMLITQQQEIGFRYIKFHDVFDDALMVYSEDAQGQARLNFNMLDEIFDFLRRINLRPLVQLSFMPKALAKETERTVFVLPFCVSEPKDDRKWCYLVKEFVSHLLKRYGIDEVSQWIFTFWNETMTGHPFDFRDIATFLHLYKITYESVKVSHPELVFASTSYVTNIFPTDNYSSFLEFAGQNGCSPDAYLFHFYPIPANFKLNISEKVYTGFSLSLSGIVSDDADAFGNYLQLLNEHLPEREKRPLYITEWNLSSSHREWLNDTCYASAYFVRNICRNYDRAQGFGHWTLTDWIEELEFPEQLFHGGVGHFTKNGIKKPAYYAYQFLSELGDELLAEGEGYFVTKGREEYRILLYNYFNIEASYREGLNFNMSFTERYGVFAEACRKEFCLELTDLPEGDYDITEKIVNRQYGSCYDKWVEMGALPVNTQEEIDALRDLSRPFLKKSKLFTRQHCLPYQAVLEPHEIRLVVIKKSFC
jgi:Beta-xylosidase